MHEIDAAREAVAGTIGSPPSRTFPRHPDLRAAEPGLGRVGDHDADRIFEFPRSAWSIVGSPVGAISADRIRGRQTNRAMIRPHCIGPRPVAARRRAPASRASMTRRFACSPGVASPCRAPCCARRYEPVRNSDGVVAAWRIESTSPGNPLASLPTGREAGRSGRLFPALAIQSHHHRRARHRLQARHRAARPGSAI